jgi:hypothetical protein
VPAASPSAEIDKFIADLKDWRGDVVTGLRNLINEAEPSLQEDWKWGVPVWTANGNVCALGVFKDGVKVNFFKGASLLDPAGLFNGGLEAKSSRSIDLKVGDQLDASALKALVRSAAAMSRGK